MDEGHQRAVRTRPRLFVDQPHAVLLEAGQRRRDVGDGERDVVQAGAAPLQDLVLASLLLVASSSSSADLALAG